MNAIVTQLHETPVAPGSKVVEYSRTEAALADLRSRFGNVVFDMRTTAGDKAARTARAEIKGYRTALETMRVDLSAPILERQRVINAEAKRITAELIALEEPIDAQIKADEQRRETERREKAQAAQRRKDEIRAKIDELRAVPVNLMDAAPDRIANAITDMEAFEVIAADFDDQADAAHLARTDVLAKLRDMHGAAVRRAEEAAKLAAERAEFERQRAEQAERDRIAAAERAEQERKDREAREAEEAQRREAQRQADDAMRAEREAHEKRMAEDREELERQQREAARTAAAMQEIQGIQQQVMIATVGRSGVRKGGTLECIRETLAETEAWEINPERFGMLAAAAENAKESAIAEICRLLAYAEQAAEESDEAAARQRAAEEAAAAERRAAEEAAAAQRRAQAEREEAERRAREAADTAVRNAAPTMLKALEEINSWLVCAGIASAEDMAQSFPHMLQVTEDAIAIARQTEAQEVAA